MNMDELNDNLNQTVARQRKNYLIRKLNNLGIHDVDTLSLPDLEREHIKVMCEVGKGFNE